MQYTNSVLKPFIITDDRILEVHYKDGAIVTLDEIKLLLNDLYKFSNNTRLKRLVVLSKNAKMELAARIYIQEHNKDNKALIAAEAIVVYSLTQKMTTNFYLKFIKDSYPSKFFLDIDKAREWLLKKGQ
jgi:hypothetical protein